MSSQRSPPLDPPKVRLGSIYRGMPFGPALSPSLSASALVRELSALKRLERCLVRSRDESLQRCSEVESKVSYLEQQLQQQTENCIAMLHKIAELQRRLYDYNSGSGSRAPTLRQSTDTVRGSNDPVQSISGSASLYTLEELKEQMQPLEHRILHYESAVEGYTQQLNAHRNRISELESETNTWKSRVKSKEDEIENLQKTSNEYLRQRNESDRKLMELSDRCKRAEDKVKELQLLEENRPLDCTQKTTNHYAEVIGYIVGGLMDVPLPIHRLSDRANGSLTASTMAEELCLELGREKRLYPLQDVSIIEERPQEILLEVCGRDHTVVSIRLESSCSTALAYMSKYWLRQPCI